MPETGAPAPRGQPPTAQHLAHFAPYSYRQDGSVPRFPDDKPLIVFDGVCLLCCGFARFVVARDPAVRFRLATAQSALGQALYRHYGLDTQHFETNLLIADGRAWGKNKMQAASRILRQLPQAWPAVGWLLLAVPPPARDWLYDRVARNRYRLFGRTEACMLPPPDWRERVLS